MQTNRQNPNLRVHLRVRKFLDSELKDPPSFPVLDIQASQKEVHAYEFEHNDLPSEDSVREMLINPSRFQVHVHHFDRIFSMHSSQDEVYTQGAEKCIDELLKGQHSNVVLYGQSQTGQSYTIEGDLQKPETYGLIPRVLRGIFARVDNLKLSGLVLRASFVRIHNEAISDLLYLKNPKPLIIREDPMRGMFIDNITEVRLNKFTQALKVLKKGFAAKANALKSANQMGSCSHFIFTIRAEKRVNNETVFNSKLNFVNLAGSEWMSVTNAKDKRLEEYKKTNQSLKEVTGLITHLTKKNFVQVLYKTTNISRLLSGTIKRDCFSWLICSVAPGNKNLEETMNTLKFATKIAGVDRNNPKSNVVPLNIFKQFDEEINKFRDAAALEAEKKKKRKIVKQKKRELEKALQEASQEEEESEEEKLQKQEDELEKYRELLLRQREIVIDLTYKLEVREQLIIQLRNEVDDLRDDNENLRNEEFLSHEKKVFEKPVWFKKESKLMKKEINSVIESLTKKNDLLDLQKIALSIIKVQNIVNKISQSM